MAEDSVTGVPPPVPCPRNCTCAYCGNGLRRGEKALPAGLDGQRRQLWDHPDCWAAEYAAV